MPRKILTSIILSLTILGGFFIEIDTKSTDILSSVSIVTPTFAATECGGANQPQCTSDEEMVKMYNKLIGGLNIALELLSFVVSPAIMLAGWLMSPDWTTGDLFNLRPILHDLWVLVSNITYFIYAILLIFIALATIFNSQNYGYKKLLPRLALGIILVPMTWWFVQFIISLSTIVTASVMNIPTEVMEKYMAGNNSPDSWWNTESIPDKYEFFTDPAYSVVSGQTQYSPTKLLKPKDILTNSSGIYGSLLIYGNGLFKFNEIKKLSTTTDVMQSIGGIVNKGILGVVMFVIFGFLVVALIFMLMMRAIKLWFYAIFSPLLTLRYVVGDGFFGGKENGDSFEIKEFIGLAFVPALVGLSLSFGIVVISVLQSPSLGTTPVKCEESYMQPGGQGCQILGIMGSPDNVIKKKVEQRDDGSESANSTINVSVTEVIFGGVTFKFYGSIVTDIKEYAAAATTVNSVLSATGSVFGTLIIDIIALIFLWSAFMAAKNVTKVAKAAFEPFEAMGKRVGKLAMDLPKYTPIPGTGGLSLKAADKVLDNAGIALQRKGDEDFKKSNYGKLFGGDKVTSAADEVKFRDTLKNAKNDINSPALKEAGEILRKTSGTNQEYSTLFTDLVKHLNDQYGDNKYKKMEALQQMGYDKEKAELIVNRTNDAKDGKINTNDSELMSAFKSLTGGSKGGNNTSAGFLSGRVGSSDSVNVTINGGTPITIKNKAGEDTISYTTEEIKKQVEGKKGIISKDDFLKSLMTSNSMTLKAAEEVAKAITSINKDYFKPEEKKSGDQAQATTTKQPPINP
ncbi:MAG: hypothetical protein HHAS10_08730 [Candidatus Altimarinota bacterium]